MLQKIVVNLQGTKFVKNRENKALLNTSQFKELHFNGTFSRIEFPFESLKFFVKIFRMVSYL